MIDRNVRRGDEHRLRVRQHIEAVFPVVMAHSGWVNATERHRLHEQMDVDLVDRATAEGQFADEAVDRLLVAAEDKRRQRVWGRGNPAKRLVRER